MNRQILISLFILLSVSTFVSAAVTVRNVPSSYSTIQRAIDAADDGDIIVVERGTYTGTGFRNISLKRQSGSKIGYVAKVTIRSDCGPPESPDWDVINETILDLQGSPDNAARAFNFDSGATPTNTQLIGLTIRNGYYVDPVAKDGNEAELFPSPFLGADPGDPCTCPGPRASSGKDASGNNSNYGGAIKCLNASPAIRYCVIENCTIGGGQGGNGARGQNGPWVFRWDATPAEIPDANEVECTDGQWGGHGGNGGGFGYGGAIACLNGSSPLISHCIIRKNEAVGGIGGNGGDGGDAEFADDSWLGRQSGAGHGGIGQGDGHGGAIFCDSAARPYIEHCFFSGNIATVKEAKVMHMKIGRSHLKEVMACLFPVRTVLPEVRFTVWRVQT
jgi:hypothetical protein